MIIYDCYLDWHNSIITDVTTLGQKIKSGGKKYLWEERQNSGFDTVVIHYISAVEKGNKQRFDIRAVLNIFCEYGVSSHFLVTRRGKVLQLVPVEKKAWHCGGSIMPAPDRRKGVNDFSVGIELVATHKSGFTDSQYKALAVLCSYLESMSVKDITFLGHSDIAGEEAVRMNLRKEAKTDPGPLFDWARFNEEMAKERNNAKSKRAIRRKSCITF